MLAYNRSVQQKVPISVGANGKDHKGNQRYQCRQCSKTFLEPQEKPLEGMYTPLDEAEHILKLLVEGCSINTIERVTGIHHTTILKLLVLRQCNYGT